jgi:hypothetical protein
VWRLPKDQADTCQLSSSEGTVMSLARCWIPQKNAGTAALVSFSRHRDAFRRRDRETHGAAWILPNPGAKGSRLRQITAAPRAARYHIKRLPVR